MTDIKPLAIIAIAKNEGRYLREWLSYHISIGVANFVIFDNESTDDTQSVVSSLGDKANIKYIKWDTIEGVSPQLSAYNAALEEFKSQFEFAAFIDLDEFIVPIDNTNLNEWVFSIPQDVSAIAISQRVFGSSGLESFIDEPVIQRFVMSSSLHYRENQWFKSIYRLSKVSRITGAHYSVVDGRYTFPDFSDVTLKEGPIGQAERVEGSRLQLHHYILKSREEFLEKKRRGGGMGVTLEARMKRYDDEAFFTGRDKNINLERNENAIKAWQKSNTPLNLSSKVDAASLKINPNNINNAQAANGTENK